MKFKSLIIVAVCVLISVAGYAQQGNYPKREFRGAWIQTIFQPKQYASMSSAELQSYLRGLVDSLHNVGFNAIIFQVRPMADALYKSELEPWSKYLTGTLGKAPNPMWDPMEFLIAECHARNMEFHAWLNPYRVSVSKKETFPKNHITNRHPDWFVRYGSMLLFDPGLPESRKYINKIVADIVSRYDIDAIHMDDYFYPYRIKGAEFPDSKSYAKYGKGKKRDDWRRENVNVLIRELNQTIKVAKPWVRFGISPFGVWRNASVDPVMGSKTTAGQTNYDDLFADVLLWSREGWIDYMLPQLYWEVNHKAAGYRELINWWSRYAYDRHMYIGEDVERIAKANELDEKMGLSRSLENVQGNCMWYGYVVVDNHGGVAEALKDRYYSREALIPAYTHLDATPPPAVRNLHQHDNRIVWESVKSHDPMQEQRYYVVYRCDPEAEDIDFGSANNIVATTREHFVVVPTDNTYYYAVTAVDRCHNESEAVTIFINQSN